MSTSAVSTFEKVKVDPRTPVAVNVRAVGSILNQTIKAIETEDLEALPAELERANDPQGPLRESAKQSVETT